MLGRRLDITNLTIALTSDKSVKLRQVLAEWPSSFVKKELGVAGLTARISAWAAGLPEKRLRERLNALTTANAVGWISAWRFVFLFFLRMLSFWGVACASLVGVRSVRVGFEGFAGEYGTREVFIG